MKIPFYVLVVVIVLLLNACKPLYNQEYSKPILVDTKSKRTVKKLHRKLYYVARTGFGVGHQDDMAYGVGWKHDQTTDAYQSDVQMVTGKLPGVFGFDIAGIENEDSLNIDGVPFTLMRELMIKAHQSGGAVTISWHANNPVTDGDSWDLTPAVADILTDSATSARFDLWMERVAGFLSSLKYKGKKVPVIFRPWHEMNGGWFWWGAKSCTPDEYKALWRRTVQTLRDQHGLHNLLYVYSPNKIESDTEYLDFYAGDEFVDILGIDIYDYKEEVNYLRDVKNDLDSLRKHATEKQKLFAFTETGLETIMKSGWFSQSLYPILEDSGISWVLFWRNANTKHHYAPYPGHGAAEDFKKFEQLPKSLFLNEISEIE